MQKRQSIIVHRVKWSPCSVAAKASPNKLDCFLGKEASRQGKNVGMNRLTFLSTTDDCFITCLLVLLVSLPVLSLSLSLCVRPLHCL